MNDYLSVSVDGTGRVESVVTKSSGQKVSLSADVLCSVSHTKCCTAQNRSIHSAVAREIGVCKLSRTFVPDLAFRFSKLCRMYCVAHS